MWYYFLLMKHLIRPEYFFISYYILPKIPYDIHLLKEKTKIIALHSKYIYAGRICFCCVFYKKICNKATYSTTNIITIFIQLIKSIYSRIKIFFHAFCHSTKPEKN